MNKKSWIQLLLIAMLSVQGCVAFAAEFSFTILDGIGIPVQAANVSIYWLKSFSETDVRRVVLFEQRSDSQGKVFVTYSDDNLRSDQYLSIDISKHGYSGFSNSQRLPVYVLKRQFVPACQIACKVDPLLECTPVVGQVRLSI